MPHTQVVDMQGRSFKVVTQLKMVRRDIRVALVPCDHCGKIVEKRPAEVRSTRGHFCDDKCRYSHQTVVGAMRRTARMITAPWIVISGRYRFKNPRMVESNGQTQQAVG